MKRMTIITGASAGIGKALAEEFSRHGHDVLLIARSKDKLRKEKEKIQSIYHTHADYIALDLMEEDAPKRVLRYVQENRISVDCLRPCGCAGRSGLAYRDGAYLQAGGGRSVPHQPVLAGQDDETVAP